MNDYMCRILSIFCLSLFMLIATNVKAGQGNHHKSTFNVNWQKDLCYTWKLTSGKAAGEEDLLKNDKENDYVIRFSNNGSVFFDFKEEVLSDSFTAFEKDGIRYLMMSSVVVRILKLDHDSLVVSAQIPMEYNGGITLYFARQTGAMHSINHLFTGTWKYLGNAANKKKFYYDYDYDNEKNVTKHLWAWELKDDGSGDLLKDSVKLKAIWHYNEGSNILEINYNGKPEKYLFRSAHGRTLILQTTGKPDSMIYFQKTELPLGELLYSNQPERRRRLDSIKRRQLMDSTAVRNYSTTYDQPNVIEEHKPDQDKSTRKNPETDDVLIVNSFKSTHASSFNSGNEINLKTPVRLQLQKDNNYVITYGKTVLKGKWYFNTAQNYVLILEMGGQERYCPISINRVFKEGHYGGISDMQVTMPVPGNKRLMVITFEPENH
jgi:hypothetical protein